MDTHFASAARTIAEDLSEEVRIVSETPVVTGLLQSVGGLVAILDENRQIIALNEEFLEMLGIDNPAEALGFRLGESLGCVHANDMAAGCGTSEFCGTCGAAAAIVTSLKDNVPAERLCALTAKREGKHVDLALRVRSQPIEVGHKRFVLILMRDVTAEQQRAALERTFFHDVNNMLTALLQTVEILIKTQPSELADDIQDAAQRIHREVAIQRSLSHGDYMYHPTWHKCTTENALGYMKQFMTNHPAAMGKGVEFFNDAVDVSFITDLAALGRVLGNMVINALEASDEGDAVQVRVACQGDHLVFSVHNEAVIPPEIRKRIFQRNFSTKKEVGRGLGTYSMKLFGEKVLGGQVSFTSSHQEGTIFSLEHPVRR